MHNHSQEIAIERKHQLNRKHETSECYTIKTVHRSPLTVHHLNKEYRSAFLPRTQNIVSLYVWIVLLFFPPLKSNSIILQYSKASIPNGKTNIVCVTNSNENVKLQKNSTLHIHIKSYKLNQCFFIVYMNAYELDPQTKPSMNDEIKQQSPIKKSFSFHRNRVYWFV